MQLEYVPSSVHYNVFKPERNQINAESLTKIAVTELKVANVDCGCHLGKLKAKCW